MTVQLVGVHLSKISCRHEAGLVRYLHSDDTSEFVACISAHGAIDN